MDRVFYALKRAYHSTLRITRRDFKDIDMTPARMDILHELYNEGRKRKYPIWQSTLRRIVGYTARSTMTQIMQALERLGLVTRKQSLQDERQLEVELTEAGFWALGRCNVRFCPGWTYFALVWAKKWRDPEPEEEQLWDAYFAKRARLDKLLLNIRIALRDTGCIYYPWWVH